MRHEKKPVLRIEKPQALVQAEARKQKLDALAGKARKPNLTDKEKLNIILEQNALILELLAERPPRVGG